MFLSGDLGYDVFFVVAGFIIGFIILKETDSQDGLIDIIHFYRNRFLRLWPALVVGSFIWLIVVSV